MLARCLYMYGRTKCLTWHVRSLSFKTAVLGWGGVERGRRVFPSRLIGRLLLASWCLKPEGKLHEDDADYAEEEAQLFGS